MKSRKEKTPVPKAKKQQSKSDASDGVRILGKPLLAIDPGANGAVAWVNKYGEVQAVPFDSPDTFLHTLCDFKEACVGGRGLMNVSDFSCVVEKVGGFVGKAQPASAAFRFGENYGFIQGVLRALKVPYDLVSPVTWQKLYPTHTKASEDKAQHKRELRDTASRLFPQLRVTLKTADALLLLDYLRKKSVR